MAKRVDQYRQKPFNRNPLPNPARNSTHETGDALINYALLQMVLRRQTLIGVPAHPLRLGRQLPLTSIEFTNQSIFDLFPRSDSAVEFRLELSGVRHLLTPRLTAGEAARAGRHPHHRAFATCDRAPEVPLLSAEVPGQRDQFEPLIELVDHDSEEAPVRALLPDGHGPLRKLT